MNIVESILLAVDSVRQNKLRASLTLLSISIGVFAIIGAGSLVSSINNTVTGELSAMGQSTFYIRKMPSIQMGHGAWHKYHDRKPITYSQVRDFKKQMRDAELISASSADGGLTLEYGDLKTNPDVSLIGTDENFFVANNVGVSQGRVLTAEDIEFNREVTVIGNDVVVILFPNISPLGKKVRIKNQMFTVIGVLESKGAILGQSQDNQVVIPVTQFLKYYADHHNESLQLVIKAYDMESLTPTIDEAIGIMRTIRNVKPWEENSFELETNEAITEQFASFTGFLSYFGFFCGSIALIAAGIGIMNIMLVSVKERTREIGIRKAVGAKNFWILIQFIIETITLCQIGGLIGILLGLGVSALFGGMLGVKLALPIDWVLLSIGICTLLGLISGAYPAWKAAKLDPIDALRYE